MDLKVLDYADEHVPCHLGEITDEMSRYIGIQVSKTYVQSVLETNGYRIVSEGGELIVDHAPKEQVG